jgi:hypothetical protein
MDGYPIAKERDWEGLPPAKQSRWGPDPRPHLCGSPSPTISRVRLSGRRRHGFPWAGIVPPTRAFTVRPGENHTCSAGDNTATVTHAEMIVKTTVPRGRMTVNAQEQQGTAAPGPAASRSSVQPPFLMPPYADSSDALQATEGARCSLLSSNRKPKAESPVPCWA